MATEQGTVASEPLNLDFGRKLSRLPPLSNPSLATTVYGVDGTDFGRFTLGQVLSDIRETATVEDFGAIGDGIVDDRDAFIAAQAWWQAADYRHLTSASGKKYRISSAITPPTRASRGNAFIMRSPIAPDEGAFRCLTIQSIYEPYIEVSFVGGGVDANYMAQLPASGRLADQAEAICVKGCRRPSGKIKADGYKGRVLRGETGGVFKNSFLNLELDCGDITTSPGSTPCGQGFAFTGSANSTAYGGFSYINTAWCNYPDLADSIVDFHATHWEATAAEFRGCGAVWMGTALLGDETKTRTGFKFTTNAAGGKCRRITFGTLQLVQFAVGLDLDAVADDNHGVVIDSIFSSGCLVGVQGKDLGTLKIWGHESEGDTVPARYYGSAIKVEHHISARGAIQQAVKIEGTATGSYEIYPIIRDPAQVASGFPHILLDSMAARLDVINPLIRGNGVTAAFDAVVTDTPNNAHGGFRILGGRVETSVKFARAEAQVVRTVQGLVSLRSFDATMPSGGTTVTVAHGLFGTPQTVTLGPAGPELGGLYWTADATSVTITVPVAVTGNRRITVTASRRFG